MEPFIADTGVGDIIGYIIAGLIVGALARLFHPGRDPMGLGLTFVIGLAAVIIAGILLPFDSFILSLIVSVVIGVALVALVGRFMANRGRAARV
jgi:uncharacterized membrane protein YeaQ/YmgE (transglycosylase-associated protein family)